MEKKESFYYSYISYPKHHFFSPYYDNIDFVCYCIEIN